MRALNRARRMQAFTSITELEAKAAEVAAVLRLLANEKRLLILCHLAEEGEISVTPLAARVGLSQSALSQHLARLREDGLVATRRASQVLYYHIADRRLEALLQALYAIYCAEPATSGAQGDRLPSAEQPAPGTFG